VKRLVIIGSGGFGTEVLDVVNAASDSTFHFGGWIVEASYPQQPVRGFPVLGDLEWLSEHRDEFEAICAIGDPTVRRRMVDAADGVQFTWIAHPSYQYGEQPEVGEGSVLCANVLVTNRVRIGRHVHLNLATTVGHGAVIGDFVTTAPGVHISGDVTVEEGAYLGTGAVILEKLRVG